MGIFEVVGIILFTSWIGGIFFHMVGGVMNILFVLAFVSFALRAFAKETV